MKYFHLNAGHLAQVSQSLYDSVFVDERGSRLPGLGMRDAGGVEAESKELALSQPFFGVTVRFPEAITAGNSANLVIYTSTLSILQCPNQRQWPAVLIRRHRRPG